MSESLGELLHQKITDRLPANPSKGVITQYVDAAIGAAIQAGYGKPQQVTTVEELDALQIGSVVIDAHGDCFQRIEDADGKDAVVWAGDFMYASSSYLALPAKVLLAGGAA